VAASLAGCATTAPPSGPTLMAQPAKGKSYDAFMRDDGICRAQAQAATGGVAPGEAAQQSTVNGAVAGTALGALAGAAIGAASHQAGAGAAIGAGAGLLTGASIGQANGQAAAGSLQATYDTAWAQCMTAKGDTVMPPPYGYGPPPETVIVAPPPPPYYWGWGYYRHW
jgi:hypothetical protein